MTKALAENAEVNRVQDSADVGVEAFLGAMRVQAAAVNVVTSDGPGGRVGVTVSTPARQWASSRSGPGSKCHMTRVRAAFSPPSVPGMFSSSVMRHQYRQSAGR